ncbi:MAG: helix-turn-helix transcriptional regulator [Parachlamydiales bacterium]|jgi:transcriptional regulator with XRE-family HTH domain
MKQDVVYIKIGARIREVREKAQMSQKSLAEAVDYETSTAISLIESGDRRVAIDDLDKIAKALHVDPRYLIGHKEQKSDIKYALRADKNLTSDEEKQILSFIEFVKTNKNAKRKS